jgi:hypothetical protein
LPEGYTRNKIQCSACGVICPVPAGAAPASSKGKAPPARKAPPSFDPMAAEPTLPPEAPKEVPNFNPFDSEPEELPKRPPPPEVRFKCRRCGRKVRRQGECPVCNGAPEPEKGVPQLELGEARREDEEEEEGTPYVLADKELPTCPKCHKEMPEGADLCVACGFNKRTRKKATKEYQPLARSWEANMPLPRRLFWWGALIGFVMVGGVVSAVSAGVYIPGFFFSWAFFALLMAFVIGTFEKIDLTRDTRGRVTITKTWRFCFIAAPPRLYEVRGYEGVVTGQWSDAGCWEWFVCLWLVPMGIVPAVLWWYHVIYRPAFHVALARDHGHPELYVYRGRREEQMRDIADVLCSASGLGNVG